MEHVVGRAGDSGVLTATLPDELEQVVDARQNVVHEDDRVKDLLLALAELVQRHERSIPDLGQVLDSVVERSSRSHRRPDLDPQTSRSGDGVKDLEQGLGLVRRTVLVDGHVDVVVAQDGGHAEQGCKEVRDDVERVVEVDREEILVLLTRQVPLDQACVRVEVASRSIEVVVASGVGSRLLLGPTPAKEPCAVPPAALLTVQRLVPLESLIDKDGLRVSEALLGVVGREGGDELEDTEALVERGEDGWRSC